MTIAKQKAKTVPKAVRPNAKERKYPFPDLKKDEFFFVPDRTKNTLASYAWHVGEKLRRKFATRLCYMRQVRGKGWVEADADTKGAVLGIAVVRVK